jgi:hypothetical protein
MLMGEENPFIDCTSSEVPRKRRRDGFWKLKVIGGNWKQRGT